MQLIDDNDQLVQQIINYQNKRCFNFNQKFYYKSYFQSIVDTSFIEKLKIAFQEIDQDGVNLLTFVRICVNIIHHDASETLYVIIVIIDLFQAIVDDLKLNNKIQYQNVLSYITDNFFNDKGNVGDYILQQRAIPQKRIFNPDIERVRQIDIDTPMYFGRSDDALRRIIKSRLITDSSHHQNLIKSGLYASEIKTIFTLDSLSDKINVYDLNCKLKKQISPKTSANCNKKDTIIISFNWSNKQLRIGATLKELSLIFWDSLDNFAYEKKIQISQLVNEHQSQIWFIEFMNIWVTTDHSFALYGWDIEKETTTFKISLKNHCIDIVELPHIKKVAIGCVDKTLQIWNLMQSQILMSIDFSQGGIHGMVFNQAYQVILTVGYENIINITQIDYKNMEHNLVGKLVGHQSMVTAVQCIDKTPMVVTTDDCGVIKVWDIRKLSCIQTIEMDSSNVISKILDIQKNLKIGFIGQRVILIEWDQPLTETKPINDDYPIRVEFDYQNYQINVCTQKEVKVLNLINGRTLKIYAGLLQSSTDDISIFRSSQKNKDFIVGDHRGQLKYFNYQTGEHSKNLKGHGNEVSGLKIDFENQLYITSGWDSNVHIQKQNKNGFEIMREIKNCFFNHEISILELSVQHNLIALASQTNKIYLFDYEFCKLKHCLELSDDNETPISIQIFNNYQLIMITSSNNKLYVLHFDKNNNNLSFQTIVDINLGNDNLDESFQANKIQMNIQLKNDELESPIGCSVYLGLMKGLIVEYDLLPMFSKLNLNSLKKQNDNTNHNLFRVSKKCFIQELQKQKLNEYQLESCGQIYKKVNQFKAHKKQITTLKLLQLSEKKLLTSSQDQFIAIWSLSGQCEAKLNVNHPLPLKWNVKIDHYKQVANSVLYSLKLMQSFNKQNNLTQNELKKIQNVNNLIKSLQKENISNTFATDLDNDFENKQILVMQDEYTNKDLQYQKHKQLLQKEIVGPSLKDMEFNKRFNKNDKNVNQEPEKKQTQQLPQTQNFQVDYFQSNYRQDLTFDVNQRSKVEYCFNTQQLSGKLENLMRNDFKEQQADKGNQEKIKLKRFGTIQQIKPAKQSISGLSQRDTIVSGQQEKLGSFFEYASLRQLDQVEKTQKMTQSINEKMLVEKKQFSQILKNIDQKVKQSQQKFKKNSIKQTSNLNGDTTTIESKRYGNKKQDDIFQNKRMQEEIEFNKFNLKINSQLDKIFIQAKQQAIQTYHKKQEMRVVLDKIVSTNNCSIEDTMWLYKQKDIIQKEQQEFLKGLNQDLLNSISKDPQKKNLQKQNEVNSKSGRAGISIEQQGGQEEQQENNNILSFLKD